MKSCLIINCYIWDGSEVPPGREFRDDELRSSVRISSCQITEFGAPRKTPPPPGGGGAAAWFCRFWQNWVFPPPPPGGISRIPRFSTIPKIPILDIPNSRICEIEISISKLSCNTIFFSPTPQKSFQINFVVTHSFKNFSLQASKTFLRNFAFARSAKTFLRSPKQQRLPN